MYAIFYFDTEDSISPPEAGNDDIVLWLADVMTANGVTGSFHIIGDKARTLESRSRHDVIAAVKQHDASSHYNHGSVHPTTPELVAAAGWDEGVRIAIKNERPGFADIERIFGVCGGLTRHGGSYAPQIIRAAGLCNKPYYGMPFHPPGHRAFWFCGTLVFACQGLVFNNENRSSIGHFEPVFPDDVKFNKQLEVFDKALHETMAEWNYTSLFGAHPLRMNTTEFACKNYRHGVNRSPLIPPAQRNEQEKAVMRANFEKLAKYLGQVKGLNLVGLTELSEKFGVTPSVITRHDVVGYAKDVLDTDDVPLHEHFSPAELLLSIAISLDGLYRKGVLPDEMPATNLLGPTSIIGPADRPKRVTPSDVRTLVEAILNEGVIAHRLPSRIKFGSNTCDASTALSVLANALIAADRGIEICDFDPGPRHPYPRFVDGWRDAIGNMANWAVFHPEIDFSGIIEHTCLQCWSVKPAQL